MARSDGDNHDVSDGLIGGSFSVDAPRRLNDCGGGLPAFAVRDLQGDRRDLMAVQVRADAPARANVIGAFAQASVPGLMLPLAFGAAATPDGRRALFVVGQAPPGPSLAAQAGVRWSEPALLELVLRPAALALAALQRQDLTHGNIRPDNVFVAGANAPVCLGQFWAPCELGRQSAVFEPPYRSMCSPRGSGEGSIADDVYAVGVLLLTLALGRRPLAELDNAAVIQRKLAVGSYEAMAGEERLPAAIADILRGMLAEDPDHRSPPELLADPAAARSRRVASRPPQRAPRPMQVGATAVSDIRTLAYALSGAADEAPRLIRSGALERWVRRGLGDAVTATRIEELVQEASRSGDDARRADAMLVMRVIAVLDPLAPLCWRGLVFWPDAIGPMLAAPTDESNSETRLDEVVHGEITATWAAMRPGRSDMAGLKQSARQHRAWARLAGWSGGRPRLRYALNPTMACASPRLEGRGVHRLADLVTALEQSMATGGANGLPLDREIAAFIAARHDQRVDAEVALLHKGAAAENASQRAGQSGTPADGGDGALALLRLLAGLQARFAPGRKLTGLSASLARASGPMLQTWRHRERRTKRTDALNAAAASGSLPTLLAILDDPTAKEADAQEARAAEQAVREIDQALARLAAEAPARAERALRLGTELAASVGAAALLAVIIAVAVS